MDSMSLKAAEELSARGATAPRVSLADMTAKIVAANYFRIGMALEALDQPHDPSLDLMTVCVLTLDNGFTVIGKSAPASAENFDAEKGKTFAYEDCIRQLWPLMGFALRERLHTLQTNYDAAIELEPETVVGRVEADPPHPANGDAWGDAHKADAQPPNGE